MRFHNGLVLCLKAQGDLADVRTDVVGLELEEEHLPQRIRKPRQSGQKSKT